MSMDKELDIKIQEQVDMEDEIDPRERKGWINKYLYLKLSWDYASGHIQTPLRIINQIIWILIFVKVYDFLNIGMIIIVGIIIFIALIIVGHMFLAKRVYDRDISMGNWFNPEIRKVLTLLREIKKKQDEKDT